MASKLSLAKTPDINSPPLFIISVLIIDPVEPVDVSLATPDWTAIDVWCWEGDGRYARSGCRRFSGIIELS